MASIKTGERAGSATAVQVTSSDLPTKAVRFKAPSDNAGKVYVGKSGVTKMDGTTDTTSGWPLSAGEESPWFPAENVNEFYIICDNATDDVAYAYLA